jgi:ApeA N-terminal domain 1
MPVDEKIECKGQWWLPEKPEIKLAGSLSITSGRRAELEIQGSFSDSHFWESESVSRIPIILGLSNNGKQITLHDSLPTKSTTNHPGLSTSILSVDHTFVGVHFKSVEEIKLRSVSAYYAHLDDWIDSRNFDVEYDGNKDEILITAMSPEPITVKVSEYEVTIRVDRAIREDKTRQVAVKYEASIKLSAQPERPLNDYLVQMRLLQHFLTLAMNEPTYPLKVKGESEASKEILEKDIQVYKPIDIYYGVPQLPADIGTVDSIEMLFTLHEVRDSLEDILNNWISKADVVLS